MSYKIRSVIKNKRGGMDVSVNSIIILIFAVIILSLGIAFIKKMFGSASQQLFNVNKEQQQEMEKRILQVSGRIIMDKDDYSGPNDDGIAPGSSVTALVVVKNYLGSDETFTLYDPKAYSESLDISSSGKISYPPHDGNISIVDCYAYQSLDGNYYGVFDKSNISFIIPHYVNIPAGGHSQIFKMIITPKPTAGPGTYYCGMLVGSPLEKGKVYAFKTFTVDVKKVQ